MKKQKYISLLLLLMSFVIPAFTQDATQQGTPQATSSDPVSNSMPVVPTDPNITNAGTSATAGEVLQTFLLENFEYPQGWNASIPLDFGLSKVLYRDGAPKEIASESNKTVLGVKTIFFRRTFGWMSIDRPYPTKLDNIVKNISVWIVGRNRRHLLFAKIIDVTGNRMRVPGGEMNWHGWKKVVIPMTPPIVQFDPIINRRGLEFFGFHIAFEAQDITVTEPYYLYMDYLTATMNTSSTAVANDMLDNW